MKVQLKAIPTTLTVEAFLQRLINDLASAAKGLNQDGCYDLANTTQMVINQLAQFQEQLDGSGFEEITWQQLKEWTPPAE